jgi:hypothetical protein
MDNEQPNNRGSSLRLTQFWAENKEAWFAIAETRFRIKRVDDQQEMFDHVVNALPKESLRTVLDLITDPPEDDPYQQLKDRRYLRSLGSCLGPGITEAFPCRHWCELQHFSALVICAAHWSAAGWPLRNSNSLLG